MLGVYPARGPGGNSLTWLEMDGAKPDRNPLEEVYMRMAEELAKRSTCERTQVGSVIATGDLTQVLGIVYNGNALGLPNAGEGAEPGGGSLATDSRTRRVAWTRVGPPVASARAGLIQTTSTTSPVCGWTVWPAGWRAR